MYAVMMHSASRRIVLAVLIAVVFAVPAAGQEFAAGEPIGALNETGVWQPMSDNVTVYGSFHFSESCTFDRNKNLILAMNTGNRGDATENDGFVSLINPMGVCIHPSGSAPLGTDWNSMIRWAALSAMACSIPLMWDTSVCLIWKQADPCGPFLFLNLRY